MASTLEISVSVKRDGKLLSNFPLTRRLQVNQLQQFATNQASGGGYQSTPNTLIAALQALLLTPDQQVTVRLNGQSDAGLIINAGGLLLFIDGQANAGASTNATVNNASGATTLLTGIAGGA